MDEYIVHGVKVYFDQEYQNELVKIIDEDTPPILKPILLKLANEKKIVAVKLSKNIIHKIMNKIKRHRLTNVLGTTTKERIYIFMDNKTFKYARQIIETLIHECIHYSFFKNKTIFTKINLRLYYDFYSNFYSEYLKADTFDKTYFDEFIKAMLKQDMTATLTPVNYRNIEKGFENHTKLNKDDFENKIKTLLNYIDDDWDNKSSTYKNKEYTEITNLLKNTFRKMFGGYDEKSFPGSVSYFPSEIIAILSTINPKHPNIIKTLKTLQ